MTNGNSAAEVSDDARLQRIYNAWQNSEDPIHDLLHAIYNYGYQRALSVCADGGKGEAVAWMNPKEGFVKDAFIWQQDAEREPQFNVPVYLAAPQAECVYNDEHVETFQADQAAQAECEPREAQPVELPERIIDQLYQSAGVSTFHPDGDQREKLYAFANAVAAETVARIAVPTPERAQESAGVRLTHSDIANAAKSAGITDEQAALFSRALLTANKEPQP
jgi:hypothetical protein